MIHILRKRIIVPLGTVMISITGLVVLVWFFNLFLRLIALLVYPYWHKCCSISFFCTKERSVLWILSERAGTAGSVYLTHSYSVVSFFFVSTLYISRRITQEVYYSCIVYTGVLFVMNQNDYILMYYNNQIQKLARILLLASSKNDTSNQLVNWMGLWSLISPTCITAMSLVDLTLIPTQYMDTIYSYINTFLWFKFMLHFFKIQIIGICSTCIFILVQFKSYEAPG